LTDPFFSLPIDKRDQANKTETGRQAHRLGRLPASLKKMVIFDAIIYLEILEIIKVND